VWGIRGTGKLRLSVDRRIFKVCRHAHGRALYLWQ
jgi:hypothetical protein